MINIEVSEDSWQDKKIKVSVELSSDEIDDAVREYLEKRGVAVPKGNNLTWGANEYFDWDISENGVHIYGVKYQFHVKDKKDAESQNVESITCKAKIEGMLEAADVLDNFVQRHRYLTDDQINFGNELASEVRRAAKES